MVLWRNSASVTPASAWLRRARAIISDVMSKPYAFPMDRPVEPTGARQSPRRSPCETQRMPRRDRRVFGNLPLVLDALILAALLAACGSSGVPPTGSPTTSPSTTRPATSEPTTTGPAAPPCGVVLSPDVVVTAQPEPCTVAIHVGATIRIALDPGFRWDTPKSDSSIVEVVNVERQSSGRLDADLRAAGVGQATVSATGSVLCAPGQPCPALARLWALHITIAPPSPGTITVTQADSGRSYALHLGDHLVVQLSGPSNYTWTEPTSSDQAVLQSTGGSSGASASAGFLAAAIGAVKVTATDNPNCYPQCLAPSHVFDVNVSVVG